jgi:hypothetical protein
LRIDELQPVLRFPGRAFEPGTAEAGGRRLGNGGGVILLCEGEILSEGPTADILDNAALLEKSGLV